MNLFRKPVEQPEQPQPEQPQVERGFTRAELNTIVHEVSERQREASQEYWDNFMDAFQMALAENTKLHRQLLAREMDAS